MILFDEETAQCLLRQKNNTQAEKLQSIKAIGDCEIKISLSTAQNTCKAIVYDSDMIHWDKEKLLDGLADQGVTAIRNVTSRLRNNIHPDSSCNAERTSTPTFIVTFNRPTPPQHLKVGWLTIPTQEYVPEPIRCFQCQRYGHFRASCESTAICSRCSEPEHRPGPCKQGHKCINCGGSHSAAWKGCPVYKEEREIRKVGYRLKIPLSAAKKIYKSYVKKTDSMMEPAQNPSSQQSSENPSKEAQEGCPKCLCKCISDAGKNKESDARISETLDKTTKAPEMTSESSEEEEPTPDNTQKPRETVVLPIQQETPNTCKAIVEDKGLYRQSRTDKEDFLAGRVEVLAGQGVIAIDRVEKSTSKLIYTFNRPTPPEHIYFGQIRIPTQKYVPDTHTPAERKSSTPLSKNRKYMGNSKIS
uniref:Uncharacterized protein n=1 Tax=Nyssomyia neivai TaxID=330878 RepID=A0A1L8D7H7_9DIPT